MPIASGAGGKPKQYGIKPVPPKQSASRTATGRSLTANRTTRLRRENATAKAYGPEGEAKIAGGSNQQPAFSAQQQQQPTSRSRPMRGQSADRMIDAPPRVEERRHLKVHSLYGSRPPWATDFDEEYDEDEGNDGVDNGAGGYDNDNNENYNENETDDMPPRRRSRSETRRPSSRKLTTPPQSSMSPSHQRKPTQNLQNRCVGTTDYGEESAWPPTKQSPKVPPPPKMVDTATSPVQLSPVAFEVPGGQKRHSLSRRRESVESHRRKEPSQHHSPSNHSHEDQRPDSPIPPAPPEEDVDDKILLRRRQQPVFPPPSSASPPPQIRLVPRRPASIVRTRQRHNSGRLRRQSTEEFDDYSTYSPAAEPQHHYQQQPINRLSRKDSEDRLPSRTTTSGYRSAASSPQRGGGLRNHNGINGGIFAQQEEPTTMAEEAEEEDGKQHDVSSQSRATYKRKLSLHQQYQQQAIGHYREDEDATSVDTEVLLPRRNSRAAGAAAAAAAAAAVDDALRRFWEEDGETMEGRHQQPHPQHQRRRSRQCLYDKPNDKTTQTPIELLTPLVPGFAVSSTNSPTLPPSPTGEEVANAILRAVPSSAHQHHQQKQQEQQKQQQQPQQQQQPKETAQRIERWLGNEHDQQPRLQQPHQQQPQLQPEGDKSQAFWFAENSQPRHLTYSYNPAPLESNPIRKGKVRALALQFNQQPEYPQPDSTHLSPPPPTQPPPQQPRQQQQDQPSRTNYNHRQIRPPQQQLPQLSSQPQPQKLHPTPAVPQPPPPPQQSQQALREAAALSESKTFYFGDQSALNSREIQNRPNLEIIGSPAAQKQSG